MLFAIKVKTLTNNPCVTPQDFPIHVQEQPHSFRNMDAATSLRLLVNGSKSERDSEMRLVRGGVRGNEYTERYKVCEGGRECESMKDR